MLRETGVDISTMSIDEAERHVAEASALREMRIEETRAGVQAAIVGALGGGD